MSRLLLVSFGANDLAQGLGYAQAFGGPFDVLSLVGDGSEAWGAEAVFASGLEDAPPAEALAPVVAKVAQSYSHIAAVGTMQSRDLLPRVAALMDAPMVTDVIEQLGEATFKRPMVAGLVVATVEVEALPMLLTFRPACFPKPNPLPSPTPTTVALDAACATRRLGVVRHAGSRPDLVQAKTIVTGGRPLKDAATFERVIGGLADALGGAVGATRAAVDNHLAPNDLQVGQTGKIVAPQLYIAAGVSGSTQHMAGMKDSEIIVAVNTDPDAPIFEIADFGIVADLFDALPDLQAKVRN